VSGEVGGYARTALREIDGQIGTVERNILGGVARCHEDYRQLVGHLVGLRAARRVLVEGLSGDMRELLGVRPTE
jgi:hypothetical protein